MSHDAYAAAGSSGREFDSTRYHCAIGPHVQRLHHELALKPKRCVCASHVRLDVEFMMDRRKMRYTANERRPGAPDERCPASQARCSRRWSMTLAKVEMTALLLLLAC